MLFGQLQTCHEQSLPVDLQAKANLCKRGDFNDKFIRAVSRSKRALVGVRGASAKQEGRNRLLPFGGQADAEVTVGSSDDEDFFVLERKARKCGRVGSSGGGRVFGVEGDAVQRCGKHLWNWSAHT